MCNSTHTDLVVCDLRGDYPGPGGGEDAEPDAATVRVGFAPGLADQAERARVEDDESGHGQYRPSNSGRWGRLSSMPRKTSAQISSVSVSSVMSAISSSARTSASDRARRSSS